MSGIHRTNWRFSSTTSLGRLISNPFSPEKEKRRKQIEALADKDDTLVYVERWFPSGKIECSWAALYVDEDEEMSHV